MPNARFVMLVQHVTHGIEGTPALGLVRHAVSEKEDRDWAHTAAGPL